MHMQEVERDEVIIVIAHKAAHNENTELPWTVFKSTHCRVLQYMKLVIKSPSTCTKNIQPQAKAHPWISYTLIRTRSDMCVLKG